MRLTSRNASCPSDECPVTSAASRPGLNGTKRSTALEKRRPTRKLIDGLKRHFQLALMLFEESKTAELERRIRRQRVNENARERVETMAHAMAEASERVADWKEYLVQARALDAAMRCLTMGRRIRWFVDY